MSHHRAGIGKGTSRLAGARTFGRAAFFAALLAPAVGRGDGASLAEALFRQAREAVHRGDYATACPLLAESQRLDPSTGTLLNLGACEEHEGHLATAWAAFRSLLDTTPESDDRATFARAHVAALEPRLAWLRLRVHGDLDAAHVVSLDGTPLGEASLGVPLAVNPGTHVVVLDAPPREKRTMTIALKEGQHEETDLDIAPLPPSPAVPTSPDQPPPVSSRRSIPWTTIGAVGVSVGGASLVVSGVLAGLAVSKNADSNSPGVPGGPCVVQNARDSCPPNALADRQSARSLGNAATATAIFGGSLVASSFAVWLLGHNPQPAPAPRVGVGVGVNGMGIVVRGEF